MSDGESLHLITGASTTNWTLRRNEIRRRVLDLIGIGPEQIPDATWDVLASVNRGDHRLDRVRILSESDDWIPAYVLTPYQKKRDPCPVVICLHPTTQAAKEEVVGLSGRVDMAYGLHLVQRGFVVVAPDHVTAGERVSKGLAAYDSREFYRKHPAWSAVGKAIWDVSRIVDVLERWDGVDAGRIGIIGHSLGGHSALFALALEERIRTGVSNCGITLLNTPLRWTWCRLDGYCYLPRLRQFFERNEPAPIDFPEIAALVVPRPFLNISALEDPTYANNEALLEWARSVEAIYRSLGCGEAFASYFRGGGHTFDKIARCAAYTWLEYWLEADRSVR